jgi:hypothetical protein
MAADLHIVAEGEVDKLVSLREIEELGIGAEDLPFEGVFGLEHVELASEGSGVSGLGELGGANSGTDEDAGGLGGEAQSIRRGHREGKTNQIKASNQASYPDAERHLRSQRAQDALVTAGKMPALRDLL